MQAGTQIREILSKDDPALEKLESLFSAMYDYMSGSGLNIDLADDGAATWLKGAVQGLGRFGTLHVASIQEEIIGFAHGSIRLTPDYLGSKKVGVITHIYIDAEYRGRGVGERLVKELESWFKDKDVHSVELQVLAGNKRGIAFWEKLGYPLELNQHRKDGKKI
jgi:ribosomal protein S18 acetylase RimI-like enzyme